MFRRLSHHAAGVADFVFFVIVGVFAPNVGVCYPRSAAFLFSAWADFGRKAACWPAFGGRPPNYASGRDTVGC